MPRCGGFKPDGTPCERIVRASQSYCYSHDPDREGERRRNAARAGRRGKARGASELADIKREIRDVIIGVLSGKVERGTGAVMFQGFNSLLKAVELERRARETDELAAEIEDLKREHGLAS